MIHGVLDPQPDRLGFALFDGAKTLLKTEKVMRGRDAAVLPGFIEAELKKLDLSLADVARWTVGAGPGSFTFLRVVAAMAAGWKYGHEQVKFRCIPGAIALAAALDPAPGETVGALYDGRNKEILYFGVTNDGTNLVPTGVTAVLNAEKAKEFFAGAHAGERCAAFAVELPAIQTIAPAGIVLAAAVPQPEKLAADTAVPFDDDLNNLVYIRPAVVPKEEL